MGQVLSVFILVLGIVEASAFIERFRYSYLPLLDEERRRLRYAAAKDSSESCPFLRSRRSLVGALVRGTANKIWSKKPPDTVEAIESAVSAKPGVSGPTDRCASGRRKVSADPVFPTVTERPSVEEHIEESVLKGPDTARPIVKTPVRKIPPLGPEFVHVGKPVQDGSVVPDLTLEQPPPPSPLPSPVNVERGRVAIEESSKGGDEEGAVRGVLRVVKSPLTRIPPITSLNVYSGGNTASGRQNTPKAGEIAAPAETSVKSRGNDAENEVRVARAGLGEETPNGSLESSTIAKPIEDIRPRASSKSGKEVSWAEDVKHIERGDKKSEFVKDVKFPLGTIRKLVLGDEELSEGEERDGAERKVLKKVVLEDGEKIEIPPPPSFPPPPIPPGKEDPGEVRIRVERPRSSRSPSNPREEVTFNPPPGERSGREATVEGRSGGGDVTVSQPPKVRDDSVERRGGEETSPPKEAFWLIFSGEYTKAMSKEWHSGHFCCWQCDESLTGQRYVLRDDHPYCVRCYESVFANLCEQCNKTIGIDSKDLSYKDKHWHEACFLCTKCRVSLVDKQFGSKADKIYCGNCYDAQFASRCDGCGEIFRAGTKKMEYKTRQWHEKCFCCCVCKTPIGTKSFIPREQEIYCATCYEEKFATRCVKCNKIITTGGVTYKNEPWHRECFTCTHCSASLAGQRFTSRDEKPYCADCFGELFAKRCVACSRPITGIGGTRFISFEDRHWHNDCFICASCKTSLVGRGFITDGEDIICPECAKQKLM